jgi:hypothetical protein
MKNPEFFIMEGRARFDVDNAIVVSCCDSLEEAIEEMKEYYIGYDYVVVDTSTNEVVFDPLIKKY